MDILSLIIGIIIGSMVTAPFLWLAGKWIVGGEKAKFTDAVWIGIVGVIINGLIGTILGGATGSLAQLIAYLYLVKTYFDTGWGNAVIISIISVVIMAVVGILLGILFGISFGLVYGPPF